MKKHRLHTAFSQPRLLLLTGVLCGTCLPLFSVAQELNKQVTISPEDFLRRNIFFLGAIALGVLIVIIGRYYANKNDHR